MSNGPQVICLEIDDFPHIQKGCPHELLPITPTRFIPVSTQQEGEWIVDLRKNL